MIVALAHDVTYLVLLTVVAELVFFKFIKSLAGRAFFFLPPFFPLFLLILLLIYFRDSGRKDLVLLALAEEPGEAGGDGVGELALGQRHVLAKVVEAGENLVGDPHVLQPQARV